MRNTYRKHTGRPARQAAPVNARTPVNTAPLLYLSRLSGALMHFLFFSALTLLSACNNTNPVIIHPKPPEIVEVKQPEKIDEKVSELLQAAVQYALANKGMLNDSIVLRHPAWVNNIYSQGNYHAIWSADGKWNSLEDSLYGMIRNARQYGLFSSDYHLLAMETIRAGIDADSLHKKNAALWARADLLYTDAYLTMAKDLALGRLGRDSVTLRIDSLKSDTFFLNNFHATVAGRNIRGGLEQLEPKLKGYIDLKAALLHFLDSVRFSSATYIVYPAKDSLLLKQQLAARLSELGYAAGTGDTIMLRAALRKYQKSHALPVSGNAGDKTIASLNNSNWQKFKRIAINLDRYKMFPDTLPHQYIWVNLPSFFLQLWNNDTLALESKIVVGKPLTRTPLLTSKITDMVTYPQWTIPESIIVKEVLPGLKKDTNYLRKKGYSLVDAHGDEVYTSSVKWAKYTKGIPYKVVQGSGDDNALGVLKFNFSNRYSVYMHDTNQRYFFGRSFRALSHGCVRVQQWDKLAHFIIGNDSLNAAPGANTFKSDSLTAWLQRKEKHVIPVKTRVPVYIRYFGCAGINGTVKFYEDIYGEDKLLTERYFANKPVN